ncbi:hypothetical protein JW935_22555 [candidate division KSB1 bacterium]|nr:hypothetical protein [candidate division KSB1 bacterium]
MKNKKLYMILLSLSLFFNFAIADVETLTSTDERYVTKSGAVYSGPYALDDGPVGVDIVEDALVIFRSAFTWDPSEIEDYAFISSPEVKMTSTSNPANSFVLDTHHMAGEPSTLSKTGLYDDIGAGTVYSSTSISTSGTVANNLRI